MQRLAEGVTEAAKRFDGVDRELARVVEQLQNGLQGFTRQIGLFVTNTDKNLAQAASHLQAAITQLEDALDDHRAPTSVAAQRR